MYKPVPHFPPRPRTSLEADIARRMSHRHDALRAWDGQVGVVLGDFQEPALASHTSYPSYELEREVGRAMLDGKMTAEQAYEALGTEKPSEG